MKRTMTKPRHRPAADFRKGDDVYETRLPSYHGRVYRVSKTFNKVYVRLYSGSTHAYSPLDLTRKAPPEEPKAMKKPADKRRPDRKFLAGDLVALYPFRPHYARVYRVSQTNNTVHVRWPDGHTHAYPPGHLYRIQPPEEPTP